MIESEAQFGFHVTEREVEDVDDFAHVLSIDD